MLYLDETKKLLVLMGIGIVFVFISIFIFFTLNNAEKQQEKKTKNYVEIEGKVVDHVDKVDDDGVLYAEVVEYVVNDQEYKVVNNVYTNKPKEIGETIKVRYNPDNPKEAVIDSNFLNIFKYAFSGLFMFIGVVFVIYGTVNIIIIKRQ